MTNELRVLLFREEEDIGWSAQVLEYNVACQAQTVTDVIRELLRILDAHHVLADRFGREPFAGIGQAPREYFDLWEASDVDINPWTGRGEAPTFEPRPAFAQPPAVRFGELVPA